MKRERPTSPESVSSDLRRAHHAHRQDRPSERACASSLYAGARLAIASATRPAYCSVSSNDGLITPAVRRPSAGSHAGDCTCVYGRAAAEQCAHPAPPWAIDHLCPEPEVLLGRLGTPVEARVLLPETFGRLPLETRESRESHGLPSRR